MKKFVLLSALALASAPAFADSFVDNNTAIYCQTQSGKKLLLQDDGTSVTYMFGKNLNKPDIVLKKSYAQAPSYIERFAYAANLSTQLSSGAYVYEVVYFSSTKDETSVNINVYKNGKELTNISCIGDSITTRNGLDRLYNRAQER